MERRVVVRAGKSITRAYATCFHTLEVLTPCPIPAEGGGILVSNHTSSLDPVLLQAAIPRLIIWMMAREYRNLFGLKWFLDAIEVIPVERSGRDTAATRAGVPVYPAYLDGSQRQTGMMEAFLRPNHAKLSFGPPLHLGDPEGREGLETATAKIQSAVARLAHPSLAVAPGGNFASE